MKQIYLRGLQKREEKKNVSAGKVTHPAADAGWIMRIFFTQFSRKSDKKFNCL